jgi:Zn-dependent peptidase ImmA (M78 family)
MKDRLTQFGTKCREFRIRYNITMGDQAKGLGLSAAYISAIERGKRPVPEDFPDRVCEWMSLSEQDSRILREIASGERTVVKVFPKSGDRALLAEDFARDLNGLSPEAVRQLREMLLAFKSEYSDDEIRKRAYLARAAFSLAERMSFNILRIIENQLTVIDPDFSLQVEPDGSLGEYLQVYSDLEGEANRFVCTEWLYNAADRGSDDSRFKLAHELAHWILHRDKTLALLRSPRTNRSLSKLHAREEREADFFAREFLMPLAIVEKFESSSALAKAAQVPLWLAKYRLREVGSLSLVRRSDIRALADEVERTTRPKPSFVLSEERTVPALPMGAAILHFPKVSVPRAAPTKTKNVSASLPLFDYEETKQEKKPSTCGSRSDQWFTKYGWRG